MPGAWNETVTSLADKEIRNLSKEDIVIVCSDANDVNRNETNIGLMHIRNVLPISHKYWYSNNDCPAQIWPKGISCINKKIQAYSHKPKKMFKLMEYSDTLETTSIGVISQNMDYT